MNKIESLLKAVDEVINSQAIAVSSSEILHLIEHNFIELDTPKFSTLLSNKIIKPIANKINELEQIKSSLGNNRTNYKQRSAILSFINELNDLLKEVFNLYHLYLKGDKCFQLYEKEENKKHTKHEDKIINGSLDEETLESIMYPTYFDVEKIQNLSSVIKEHLTSLNLDKDNYEFAKDRTKLFHNKTKDSIYIISKAIDKSNTTLKHAEIKLKNVNENEVYEDVENSIIYNIKEYYHQNVTDLYCILDNLNRHKSILTGLFDNLTKSYFYLADTGTLTHHKTTVFGDSNFEIAKQLALELKVNNFVSNQATVDDLVAVFTHNEENPKNKINLMNGNLNDFAYLMLKMKPFFMDAISNKANYSLWWSERFTFNSKHKDKKSISNMISNIEKGIRIASKKQVISNIIESLNPIPQ